ncbi:DUF5697 family protein [Clostridium oryzae]|uniref:Uncharacterized protein n=1 Tax=Clostridium oryzae TaxID=1450648 RepID=A0A1V4IIE7_9CLOT|nr:DUF5697 family protein [Clostridium oryzae]OPJ59781.1 hypothetical protein CLORY_31260 [Clostridium oryzae]
MYYINKRQKSLLNLVNKFGCISFQQIISLISRNKHVEYDLKGLVLRRLIVEQNGIYKALSQHNIDCHLLKCIDVICCLNDRIQKCEKEEFPFCLWVYLKNDENYDICYIPVGQEMIYTTTIRRCNNVSNIIAVLDNKSQINQIQLQNINIRYCTLNPVKFYRSNNGLH